MDCITCCEHCGSKIKGHWIQKELEIMAKYSKKYNNDFTEVRYEKESNNTILALHMNKMTFNWITFKERIAVEI